MDPARDFRDQSNSRLAAIRQGQLLAVAPGLTGIGAAL